jgi:drug/metabolite transporter (DMT)-like permease
MSGTLIATLAGTVTLLCWGTADWLTARSTKHYDTFEINFVVQTVSVILAVVVFFFYGLHVQDTGQVIRIALSSLLIVTAYQLFIQALSSGVLGIIVPIGNIYPLFTIVLSMVFLSTHIKSTQLVAMIGIVLGAALLAYEKNVKKLPFRELHKESGLALTAALIWGLGFFVLNPVVDKVSWQSIVVISETTAFILALLLIVATKRGQTFKAIKGVRQARLPIVVGLLGTTGMVAVFFGSNKAGSVLIPTVLSAGAPLVTSFLGALFESERLGIIKRAGAVIVVAGIIVLNAA